VAARCLASNDLAGDIREVLRINFSQYAVNENVPVTAIDPGQDFGGPIDFALVLGGRIVAVIMLVQNTKRNKRFWGVEKACTAKGVKLLNFYYRQWFTPEGATKYIRRELN